MLFCTVGLFDGAPTYKNNIKIIYRYESHLENK